MKGYDIVGNIAIVKFDRGDSSAKKKKEAVKIIKENKGISTVLEKSGRFKGRLRTLTTKFIAGQKTKEALYRENGCTFRFNVDNCYFSPRLSNERIEVARMVKPRESVLIMCGGVAPFAIIMGKISQAEKIVSVELSRECSKYALENVKRNKLQDKIKIVQGNVRKVLPKMNEKFDRIVMTRPNLTDPFLDVAFKRIRKGGIIHYYGFYSEDEVHKLRELIESESENAGRKIKILKIKKAGDIGVKKFRYRVDFKVLN